MLQLRGTFYFAESGTFYFAATQRVGKRRCLNDSTFESAFPDFISTEAESAFGSAISRASGFSVEQCQDYDVTGPVLRAAGVTCGAGW